MTIELLNMDCMEYMKGCEDNAFDLAIVDPPYGRGEHGGKNRTSGVKQKNGAISIVKGVDYKNKGWDHSPPPPAYFTEIQRISRNQIIFGVNYHPGEWRGGRIIWDKCNDCAHQSDAEIAFCSLNQRVDIVRYMWNGMMQGAAVGSNKAQGNKRLNEKRIHPTQKPRAIYDWLLNKYSNPGQKIIDTHLGSGSSAIAAHYFGCDFVGMEIDKDYYDAALNRFEAETAQLDIFG